MTTTTTRRRTTKSAACDCHAHGRLIYPCELLTEGSPLPCTINGTNYLLSAHGPEPIYGYRFTKADGTVYDLDVSDGYVSCDCADATFRERACKHSKALMQFHLDGAI